MVREIEETDLLQISAELAQTLEQGGYSLETCTAAEAEILEPDTENVFFIYSVGGWVQVRCIYFSPEQVDSASCRESILNSLLLVHFRLIGCRFALDEDGAIWLILDLISADATPGRILEAVNQLQYVVDVTIVALENVLRTGEGLTDEHVDQMFESQAAREMGVKLH